jgi:hypothetical protein
MASPDDQEAFQPGANPDALTIRVLRLASAPMTTILSSRRSKSKTAW